MTGRDTGRLGGEPGPSEDLQQALAYLGRPVSPGTVVRTGYLTGLAAGGVASLAGFVVAPGTRPVALAGAVIVAVAATHVVHVTPRLVATARRTNALGAAPDLLARAILLMRLSAPPERAAAFAAASGESRLATSLGRHVQAARAGAGSGFEEFGAEWADWFPALDRAVRLVVAAGGAEPPERERLLERAMAAVLEGTRTRMQEFAGRIRGPATALYAFGVLLPTALIALLPAARAAGVAVTPPVLVGIYGVLLPVCLVAAGTWLVVRRPVAFPPPQVTTAHPAVPDWTRLAPVVGGCLAVVTYVVSDVVSPDWTPPVVATGVGLGATLQLRYGPRQEVHDRVRAVEAGLADALVHIGRRVAAGTAVETAVEAAAADVDGEMGTVLAAGARHQRQLRRGIDEAFLDDDGALAVVPSRRVRGAFGLLALAAREGRPAGEALLSLADHVEDLREIGREARTELDRTCATLRTTGSVFGPLVAGTTVALAGMMTGGNLLRSGSIPWLGTVVGWYVLFLAAFLPALATGLVRGFDRTLVGVRAGRSLVSASLVYAGTYLVTRFLA
ncbi:MAG: type II secretion system protein [Salinirussus sp.]